MSCKTKLDFSSGHMWFESRSGVRVTAMDTKLEKFVSELGGCGLFQVYLSVAVYTIKTVGAWGVLFLTFGTYNPGWTCADDSGNTTDVNSTLVLSTSTPNNITDSGQENCATWHSCSDIRFDPESSTIVSEWGLICDRAWLGPLTISIQMVGMTISSLLGGVLAERFGRKFSMYLWVWLGIVLNGVAVFSTSWEMYAAIRFLIGLSVGGNLVTSQIYALEFVTAKWRVILTGLPTWNIAGLLFGLCVLLLKNWRHVHIATAVLSACVFLTVFWVPESMRWLAIHGKAKKTREVAQKICRINKRPKLDESSLDFTNCEGRRDDKKVSIRQLFRPDLRKRTIVCCTVYFLMSVMYYSIGFGIGSLYGNFYTNFLLFSLFGMPVSPLATFLGHKLGRRWGSVTLLGTAGLFSFTVVVVYFKTSVEVGGQVITLLALTTSVLVDHCWGILITFIAELFPTPVRVLSFGFVFTAARIGSIVSPLLIPRDFSVLYVSYIIMAVMATVTCALVLSMPETKDRGLEDKLHGVERFKPKKTDEYFNDNVPLMEENE
ncbi:solute carrier family 22 member 13-like [Aplysia californica]|uniref:Solute carrier family 22 member 13-like n=1 Tax=Aplysia californica TaxID=6500 RepID=A0ABM0JIR1_APLCA|nr:solute carrier family 22 member 13-like [Aplysia californica]